MYTLQDFTVPVTATVLTAFGVMDKNKRGFVVAIEEDGHVAGTLTDGDIRRKLMAGVQLDERLCDCKAYQTNFTSVPATSVIDDLVELFRNAGITFLPFVNEDGTLAGLITRGQLYALLLRCEELPGFDELLNVDETLMDFEIFQRPWGIYKTTVLQDAYQGKILQVRPGAQLSLQYHLRREEHWIVVDGEGTAQVGDSIIPVQRGSVVFIPRGCKHRMTNTSATKQLIVVEAQIGDYFGEDDIVRIEDRYGRAPATSCASDAQLNSTGQAAASSGVA